MNRTWTAVLLAGATVSACGGGSGGASGVPVVSGSVPTPTPTPTPSASPTPTPAPYPTYAQLSGDQSFKTSCGALRFDGSTGAVTVPVTPFGGGLTLSYAAAGQTYTVTSDAITAGGFGPSPRSYGPADRDTTVTASTSYARTVNGFQERLSIGSNVAAGASPDYVRGFSLRVPLGGSTGVNPPAIQYQCVFGVPTRLDDEPRGVSVVNFTRTGFNGTAIVYPPSGAPESYAVTKSVVSFSVNLATYQVTTTIRVIGNLATASGLSTVDVDLGTYSGTVTIDEAGYYNGLLTTSDRTITGTTTFGGWFFGPQGAEAAFSTSIMSFDSLTGRRLSLIGNALALR